MTVILSTKQPQEFLEISKDGLTSYPGNYQDYLHQKEKEAASSETAVKETKTTESKLDWQQQKELQAKQRKKENRLKKVEDEITPSGRTPDRTGRRNVRP